VFLEEFYEWSFLRAAFDVSQDWKLTRPGPHLYVIERFCRLATLVSARWVYPVAFATYIDIELPDGDVMVQARLRRPNRPSLDLDPQDIPTLYLSGGAHVVIFDATRAIIGEIQRPDPTKMVLPRAVLVRR
jgi:hypothetical protein